MIAVLNDHADTRLESQIDKSDYDESQLIEIKVAMNMPYQERFTDFERHYGQIEIDGKSYTYVKMKIAGDMAIFKCIPNESKQLLKTINNELTKANSSGDMDHSGKQQSSFAKNFWSEYDEQNVFQPQHKQLSLNKTLLSPYTFFIPQITGNTPHQPPEC